METEMENTSEDMLHLCRACLLETKDVKAISEDNCVASVLTTISKVVYDDNQFSRFLCLHCFNRAKDMYDFINMFNDSQEVLMNNIKSEHEEMLHQQLVEKLEIEENPVCIVEYEEETECDNDLQEKPKIQYTCPVCGRKFRILHMFYNHIERYDEVIFCNLCKAIPSANGKQYLEHLKEFHRFECQYCKKHCKNRRGLTRHVMKEHSTIVMKYVCPEKGCEKVFLDKQTLKRHFDKHKAELKFNCQTCGEGFVSYDSMRYHRMKHTGGQHLCSYCGKRFIQSVHLKYHMWKHTGIKPFSCENCGKTFVTRRLERKHYKDNETCASKKFSVDEESVSVNILS